MSERTDFERLVEVVNEAMLDETKWPATSALIDQVCGVVGNGLFIVEGSAPDLRVHSAGLFYRGHRREDLERTYLENYHPTDEGVPRFRQLPFRRVVRVVELYRPEERKTSPTYNEFLPQARWRNGVSVRLHGFQGCSHIAWVLGDPVAGSGWAHSRISMIGRLCSHIRQFVGVRQALESAGVLRMSLNGLLNETGLGVVQLDGRGRIATVNDRAARILKLGDGLADRDGSLQALQAEDNVRLEQLIANALPEVGVAAVSASVMIRRSTVSLPLIVHVKPMTVHDYDFAVPSPGALVLISEPGRQFARDPLLVGAALGLTPAESRLAVWLAEGKTVHDIARATERKESSVYWLLRQIYRKRGISRQADLVRLVLSVDDFG